MLKSNGSIPTGIKRFDKGECTVNLLKDEVHFTNGTSLFRDGTCRYEKPGFKMTNKQKYYLQIQSLNEEVESELKDLWASDQVYNLYLYSSDVSEDAGGNTKLDPSTGDININIKEGYDSNIISHELKHAFQFEKGRISYKSNGLIGELYDLMDEREAYKRGRLFGETRTTSLEWLQDKYPDIKDNTTQITLDTKAPFSDLTYREIYEMKKMKAAANGGKGVILLDVYIDPKN